MPISKTEVTTSITPSIPSWIDSGVKEEILEEVGRYVATEIALRVGDGESPVNGYGKFKLLSKDYAEEEKGGDKNPNLELHGDLMRSLDWRVEMDEVKVGFFDRDQAIKAYGHNTGMKGHKWLDGKAPVRRIIPDEKESFVKDIQDGIDLIVDGYVSTYEEDQEEEQEAVNESPVARTARDRVEAMNDWLTDIGIDDEWWL